MVGVVGTAGEWRKEKSIIWGGVGLEKKRAICVLVVDAGELTPLNFRLVLLEKDEDDPDGEATNDGSGLSWKSVELMEHSVPRLGEDSLPFVP